MENGSLASLEVLSGLLSVKQPALIKHKTLDKHWCILYHGVKTLTPRIDILDKNAKDKTKSVKKTIYLESATWKKLTTMEPAFSIELKNNKQYIFHCESTSECRNWILHLCCICGDLFDSKHVVGVSNEGNISASAIAGNDYTVVLQNDVYGGVSESQQFFVLADRSQGCRDFGWNGIFKLSIGLARIKLMEYASGHTVVDWHITELRNFGISSQTLFLELGKRSSTGEGKFVFRTTEASKITGTISREAERVQDNKTGAQPVSAQVIPPQVTVSQPVASNRAKGYDKLTQIAEDDSTYSSVEECQPHAENPSRKMVKAPEPPKRNMNAGPDNVYNNMAGRPPISPTSSSPSAEHGQFDFNKGSMSPPVPHDRQFLKQLDTALESRSPLERKESTATVSSESESKKDQKKRLKDAKKEQKRKEEEEKKARKKQQEEEKKEQKRREAENKKKLKNKGKHEEDQAPPSYENVYAEAYGSEIPQASAHSPEEHYAVSEELHNSQGPSATTDGRIYCDPWGKNPVIAQALHSPHTQEPVEDVYAEPSRVGTVKVRATVDDNEEQTSNSPPPIIPPNWEQRNLNNNNDDDYSNESYSNDNQNDNGSQVYAQTNQLPAPTYEHVYGIGSASREFTPSKEKKVSAEYECVG